MDEKSQTSLFFYLNPFAFLVAFGLGIMVIYMMVPPARIVIKFPNPYNSGKITYRGEGDNCYKYKSEEVACPLNEPDRVRIQPV